MPSEENIEEIMAFNYTREMAIKALSAAGDDVDGALDWLQANQEDDISMDPLEKELPNAPLPEQPIVKDQAYYQALAKQIAAKKSADESKKFYTDEQRRREEGKAMQKNQEKFEEIRKEIERKKEEREREAEKERRRRIIEKVRMEREMRRDNKGRLVDPDGNELIVDNSTISNEYRNVDLNMVSETQTIKLKVKGPETSITSEFKIDTPLRDIFIYLRKNGMQGSSLIKIGAPGPFTEQTHSEYTLRELGITAPTLLQLRN